MSILRGYEYLFYRVYSYQLKPWGGLPIFAAHVGVYAVTLTSGLNVMSILFILESLLKWDRYLSNAVIADAPYIYAGMLLAWFGFVYRYFVRKDKYKKIVSEFSQEPERDRMRRGILTWVYSMATVGLLFTSIFVFNKPA